MGHPLATPADTLLINGNYFWRSRPIGALIDEGRRLPETQTPKLRSFLVLIRGHAAILQLAPQQLRTHLKNGDWKSATVLQAGPRIIHEGRAVTRSDLAQEGFRRDVYRRTNHTVIGITRTGKLLFAFMANRTLAECTAILLRYGAVEAINLDGGSSASLHYQHLHYGRRSPMTALAVTRVLPHGAE
jgi:hypothetical protein